MNVGLILGMEHPAGDDPARRFAEHREQVRLARAAGFDLVGIPHHYSRGPSQWFPPLVSAAALAADAGQMRIATTVLLLPMLHPVETAEQAAMLDVLTGGRFVFGVGAGWQPAEFHALGVPMEGRLARLEEALTVIEPLWTGDPVTFHGRHFALEDVRLTLRPVQRPRPPIWMGANAAAAAVRRAARLADAWIVSAHPDLETVERHLETYREALDALGKPFPPELPVLRNAYVAADLETALAEARPYFEARGALRRRPSHGHAPAAWRRAPARPADHRRPRGLPRPDRGVPGAGADRLPDPPHAVARHAARARRAGDRARRREAPAGAAATVTSRPRRLTGRGRFYGRDTE